MSIITRQDVRASSKAWQVYEAWDSALYDLCGRRGRGYADHKDRAGVFAKVYLIGRSYSSGVERHAVPSSDLSGLERVGTALWKRAAVIDKLIGSLRNLGEAPDRESLDRVCRAHADFMAELSPLMRTRSTDDERNSPRSFVSKYLHFHAPIVPIFDSRALTGVKRVFGRRKPAKRSGADGLDYEYWRFCQDIANLSDSWPTEHPTARDIDKYLLYRERHG